MSERFPVDAAEPAGEGLEQDEAPGAALAAGGEQPAHALDAGDAPATGAPEPPHAEARLRSARGDHVGAAELYAAAVARTPDDLAALLGLTSALLAMGQYEGAEREIRRAVRVAPERPDVHLQLGVVLHKRAVYPAAAAALRRAVELDPECSQGFLLLGETLNQLGESAEAIEALEQVVRLEPSARSFYALGIAYDRKGQPERAAEMYRRSRTLNGG